MKSAFIGLGSNLDEPLAQVRSGIKAIARLPATSFRRCSSYYRTAAIGPVAQQDFINAVCEIETQLLPEILMKHLLEIERMHGRIRDIPSGPRTLDLDLLLYNDITLQTESVVLPHPRLHERAFVLYPLSELVPQLTIPGRGAVADLLRACNGQAIERLSM